MFHEESRFQTKRENKRRGDTDKCHGQVGKGQTNKRKRLDGYIYVQIQERDCVTAKGTNKGKWKEKNTVLHILALLHDKDMQ